MQVLDHKEKRLRLLAKRAGDLSVSAYLGGNRDRAIFFNEKRKRILWPLWAEAQGEDMFSLVIDPDGRERSLTVAANPGGVVVSETNFEFLRDRDCTLSLGAKQARDLAKALFTAANKADELDAMLGDEPNLRGDFDGFCED